LLKSARTRCGGEFEIHDKGLAFRHLVRIKEVQTMWSRRRLLPVPLVGTRDLQSLQITLRA